jgi:hypothetical protein
MSTVGNAEWGFETAIKEPYDQPLLVRHGPLRDVTGTPKVYEKTSDDKDTLKDVSDKAPLDN